MMASRPTSPVKHTIIKLLSPKKPKPPPPLALQLTEQPNWCYADSTSSSNSTYSEIENNTGWEVEDSLNTPITHANKENLHVNPQELVDQVMGTHGSPIKAKSKDTTELDREFEELMVLSYSLLS